MTPLRTRDRRFACACLATGLLALAAGPVAAGEQEADERPLQAELVARHAALQPGTDAQLGLRLRHAPHWHSYWINPGDSGLPTRLAWQLPEGWKAGDIEWPLPHRYVVGSLHNFGYEGDIVLPVTLGVPADARPGTRVRLALTVRWLACREACVPGKDELALELPVAADAGAADPRWSGLFAAALRAQPQPAPWQGSAAIDGERVRIRVSGAELPPLQDLDAHAVQRKLLDNRQPTFRREGDDLVIETGRSEYFTNAPERFDLVLTTPDDAGGRRGWMLALPLQAPATTGLAPR